ncbi:MAG: STT3 domain-containing protein [Candidatus Nanohaloarchaea archaeon]
MRDIFEKINDFFTVEGLKSNWAVLSVAAIFMFGVWLRYAPEQGMAYLQALDPYMIFRMSKHMALEGGLPPLDFMRYFPYAQPVYSVQLGDIAFPALFYWLGPFLFFPSYLEWAQFFPALMGGVGILFMYLFARETWNRTAGVSAAFFLATIAGVLHRTSAGFFEKEPVGTAFMMMSLYFFSRAWKREDWYAGIGSGLALAAFTLSWGGSRMMWLLYPLVVGTVLLLDEDIEGLTRAYTPTVIIGGAAAAVQPARFWFTGSLFIANIGMVGLLWSRRLVEELEIIGEDKLSYYTPTVSLVGAVLAGLSPLYSDFIASRILSIMKKVTQGTSGDVIAGTVAENQAASLSQVVSQLGALSAVRINPLLGYISNVAGPWPLMFIGVAFLGTSLAFMVARKYGLVGATVEDASYYYAFSGVLLAWVLAFSFFFQSSVLIAVLPAVFAVLAGAIAVYTLKEFGDREIEYRWYYFLPFFWTVTNVLAAVAKSRLIFLAAFPVAMGAGYTLSLVIDQLREFNLGDLFRDVDPGQARAAALVLVLLPVLVVNAASGYASSQQIGGSPNQLWMENLDYMSSETPEGSVILSWWDYGYWFESIGRRPAVADGGNAGFYSSERYGKVNYPIADFLTSSHPSNHTYLLEKHSVDYLVLDNSMIGKYSAVSQISNRDNSEFESMLTLGTNNLRNSLSRSGNSTVAQLTGRGIKAYVPVSIEGSTIDISGAPNMEVRGSRIPIDCVLTENGRKTFNVTRQPARYCAVEDPYYSFERGASQQGLPSRVILVPKSIADSTLVRLYLMDGYGLEWAEKVPGGSNGYIKMWKIDKP